MIPEKKAVLEKYPTAEIERRNNYKGKKVFWVTFFNHNHTQLNILGVGNTQKEAWINAHYGLE